MTVATLSTFSSTSEDPFVFPDSLPMDDLSEAVRWEATTGLGSELYDGNAGYFTVPTNNPT